METKWYFGCFKDEKYSDIGKRMGTKKRRKKYLNKEWEQMRDFFYSQEWSEPTIKFISDESKTFKNYHKQMKKM